MCCLFPASPLLYLPVQHVGDVGLSLRVRVPNLGYLEPDLFWEVSVSFSN